MQTSRNTVGERRRRVAVVGGGQAGLQLALGLTGAGYAVTLATDRDADALERGTVRSTQCMFDAALRTERRLGLDAWQSSAPQIHALEVTIAGVDGTKALEFTAPLRSPAQSVDQRLKLPRWLRELEALHGAVRVGDASLERLEELADDHELVVIASGQGPLSQIFERDGTHSPYDRPQRALAVAYVNGVPRGDAVRITIVPEVGELFAMPCLTLSGPCEILFLEGVPGGPFDAFDPIRSAHEHLECMKGLLREHVPWEAEHVARARVTDAQATLSGRLTPVVRRPVSRLPSGRPVLGLADAVVLNDPITGQGSNTAAKSADIYLREILARGQLTIRRELDAGHRRASVGIPRSGDSMDERRARASAPPRPRAIRGRRPLPGGRDAHRGGLRSPTRDPAALGEPSGGGRAHRPARVSDRVSAAATARPARRTLRA